MPINLTRNNFEYEQHDLNRSMPYDRKLNNQQSYHQNVLHNNFENEKEILDLQRRLETLQRKKNEFQSFNHHHQSGLRRNERKNDNLEHASIMADCGTPSRPKYDRGKLLYNWEPRQFGTACQS